MSTYQFTAYMESDLLSGSNTDIGVGDTFTLPEFSSVTMTVTDDDAYLSGDYKRNENADDNTGQTAEITDADGTEVGNGGQIYAEQYFWVYDQYGNWYIMVEIEQEGAAGDYFVFYNSGGYTYPPADAILTIDSYCNVTCDWLEYCSLEGGEMPSALSSLSGRLFTDADGDNTEWNAETGAWEDGIEGMTVTLYQWNGSTGVAIATTTTGADGSYDFGNLEGGWYYVAFTKPDGTEFVQQNVGNDFDDSDANASGFTGWICVVAGEDTTNVDAGVTAPPPPPGAITGTVFDDADGDGVQDQGAATYGANLIVNGDFETNALNNSGGNVNVITAGWQDIGFNKVAIHEQDYGFGNEVGEAVAKLYMNTVLRQELNVTDAGSYQLSFDVHRNYRTGDADNTFALYIDDVLYSNYTVTTNGRIEIDLNLASGGHSIEFRGLGSSYDGAGIDNVAFQQVTTTSTEAGVAGVTVYLLDASGNEILDEHGQPVTTVTDANGDYAFDGVEAGDYKVRFDAPDGFAFTGKDVGGDDSVDSDVNLAGESDVISVAAGLTSDVDAGLVANALDDGDEIASVGEGSGATALAENALANTIDNDGGAPVVASVGGVALNGGSASVAGNAGGVFTFNADGTVSFDTNGAFGYLSEGQQVVSSVTYEVSDGQGGLVTSTYSVTVTGTEGQPIIDAMDDVICVFEDEGANDVDGNVLDNDDLPYAGSNLVVEVNGQTGLVGQWIDLPSGGRVKLNADGNLDFDANGAYDSLGAGQSAFENLTYTVRSSDGSQDAVVAVFEGPNGLSATAEIVELNGELVVTLTVQTEGGDIGDIRGFFFDVSDESLLGGMSATGADITNQEFDANSVFNLGGGNNVNGDIIIELGKFDGGVTAGTQGMSGDDIRSTTFTLSHDSVALTLDLLLNQDMALRLTSVGEEGGERGDSLKLGSVGLPSSSDSLVDTATVTIEIKGINEGPDAIDDVAVTDEETPVSGNILANDTDPNGDALTVTGVSFGNLGEATSVTTDSGNYSGSLTVDATGAFTFTPDAGLDALAVGDVETVTFTYDITDGNGGTDTATVTITINGLNEPPVAVDDAISIGEDGVIAEAGNDEGESLNILANDSDPNGDSLTVAAIVGGLVGAAFSVVTAGGRTVNVTVNANGDLFFDTAGQFDALAAGETDSFQLTYTADDGNGGQDDAVVTITINGDNEPPVAVNDAVTISEDGAVGIGDDAAVLNVLTNDSDPNGDALTVTSVNGVAAGSPVTVTTANGVTTQVVITSTGEVQFGTDGAFDNLAVGESDSLTVTYTISDGNGGTDTATATITIEGLNEPPVAADDAIAINESEAVDPAGAITLNVLANDSDPNGDALTVASVNGAAAGTPVTVTTANGVTTTATIAANGDVTFDTAGLFDDLNDGESDSFTLSYTADDGNGGQDDATVTITINGEGQPQGDTSYNIVFLVDSASTLNGASAIADAIIGSAGSLDLNGDGVFNSLLDAELFIVQQMNAELASLGLGSDVEMGLYTFDTELGFGVANEEAFQLTAGATGANGTFTAGDDLTAAFGEASTGGVSSYNTAVAGANDFFAFATANDAGSTTVNLVYMLTDGDGFDWTFGGDDPLSTELTTLTGTYGAEMDTIILNAANAGSTLIAQIESAAGDGVTNVLDSETDVNTYVSGLGSDLIV